MATSIIMADVDGQTLTDDDKAFLAHKALGGIILFKRNVLDPAQVRALTDSIRAINPNLIISADQEGGRVARFRDGFTPLPAMGRLGDIYNHNQALALSLAPVLDINGCSTVIGDRAFHTDPQVVSALSACFIDGMNKAGMKATGKHFPGHGSIAPDSHLSEAIDTRSLDEIWECDLVSFCANLNKLHALMPAHVIFSQIDDKPAGFSQVWLQDILRGKLGFEGVIFSDDLSMAGASVVGGIQARVSHAISAGCDMALVCNSRTDAICALDHALSLPDVPNRFGKMKSVIPTWQGDLESTCLSAFGDYETVKARVQSAFFADELSKSLGIDPTSYKKG